MDIGSKIKKARTYKNMTQAELCGDFITRNMLSAIENNRALPSLPALEYFVEKLEISAQYFFSSATNPLPFMLEYKLPYLRRLSDDGKYEKLIEAAEEYKDCLSHEVKLMVANAHYMLGKDSFSSGKLEAATEHFNQSRRLYGELGLDSMEKNLQTAITVTTAFKNQSIPSPFDCFRHNKDTPDFIFYLYIIYMIDHGMVEKASSLYDTVKFNYQPFKYHINSRLAAAKFNYERAQKLLAELIFSENPDIPVPLAMKIICELEEYCIKNGDYKTAYECTVLKGKLG